MHEPAQVTQPIIDNLAAPSILVVKHEGPTRRDIQSSLARFGYDVRTITASASAALRAVETYHPDLVLMDFCLE
jgi:CheY-like chemotaxis protein